MSKCKSQIIPMLSNSVLVHVQAVPVEDHTSVLVEGFRRCYYSLYKILPCKGIIGLETYNDVLRRRA